MEFQQHLLASCTLAIIVFGCFGNVLSVMVFLKRRSSINILLSALSLIDLCLLLFAVPVFVLPNLQCWEDIHWIPVQAIIVKFLYPINLMFQTCSIYTIVLITFERWLAICRPLHVRSLCTPRTAKRLLCAICGFALCYNVIRFWEYSLIASPDGTGLWFRRNLRDPTAHPLYMLAYYSLLFLVSHFLLPFGAIFTLNGLVAHRILRLRLIRAELTKKQLREHKTTAMLLLLTLSFAVCNALPFLLNLAECIRWDLFQDEHTAPMAYLLNDLANFLVILNSSTTWIYYIIFSAKYRQGVSCLFGLKRLIPARSGLNPEEHCNSATSNNNNNNNHNLLMNNYNNNNTALPMAP